MSETRAPGLAACRITVHGKSVTDVTLRAAGLAAHTGPTRHGACVRRAWARACHVWGRRGGATRTWPARMLRWDDYTCDGAANSPLPLVVRHILERVQQILLRSARPLAGAEVHGAGVRCSGGTHSSAGANSCSFFRMSAIFVFSSADFLVWHGVLQMTRRFVSSFALLRFGAARHMHNETW